MLCQKLPQNKDDFDNFLTFISQGKLEEVMEFERARKSTNPVAFYCILFMCAFVIQFFFADL